MRNNVQTNELRNTVMLRLRKCNRLCSRTVSDTANRLLRETNTRREKSSAVLLFRSGRMSAICARLIKQGKGRSSKRKENRRLSFLFAPAVGTASSPPRVAARSAVRRRRIPPLRFSEKLPPVRGEPACGSSSAPLGRCRERCRPDRANTLTQFVHPGQPVLKKLPPRSSEPPARFVCPA